MESLLDNWLWHCWLRFGNILECGEVIAGADIRDTDGCLGSVETADIDGCFVAGQNWAEGNVLYGYVIGPDISSFEGAVCCLIVLTTLGDFVGVTHATGWTADLRHWLQSQVLWQGSVPLEATAHSAQALWDFSRQLLQLRMAL